MPSIELTNVFLKTFQFLPLKHKKLQTNVHCCTVHIYAENIKNRCHNTVLILFPVKCVIYVFKLSDLLYKNVCEMY